MTRHPTGVWVSQRLREAFPFESNCKYLIHNRDVIFRSAEVIDTVETLGISSVRTAFKSPWQNGVAERFVTSCLRDLLDYVIILNKHHLKQLMHEFVRYYHEDRTHLGLGKQTPAGRKEVEGTALNAKVLSMPKPDGVHLRYYLAA